ncbi:hypothetical protein M9Y10_020568 [Tritrichomonas musculus]|uniref:HNH nuclease domain-containing protein n=1 Tax=Tritrichomonas musculus TaxID=1915356 RepID=A0ABR2HE19_9EUKA
MIEVSEFVTVIDHEEYEILTTYPHTIRRKDNHYIVNEFSNNNGYICLYMNRTQYQKHRIIAKQFIFNPNNYNDVDHINHNRSDYRIQNLRWCSRSSNNFNKSSANGVHYEFIENIPIDSIKILFYNIRNEHYEFEDEKYYYYCDENENDIFYAKVNDNLYRVMHINTTTNNRKRISMRDINNKKLSIYVETFKHQHSLD